MTLQFLAQKVGTTAQTIQRLETANMTVSLDWLTRIADAFGVPAAALIVTEKTESVPVIGEVDSVGDIKRYDPAAPLATLSLVVAAPSPIAVRVAKHVSSFEVGTLLIGNKIDFDPDYLTEAQECLVALKTGRIVLRRVTTGAGGTTLELPETASGAFSLRESGSPRFGQPHEGPYDIDWIAPILMAVRYFP